MRLDKLLVTKGYFTTRQKAKEAIKRGFVTVDGIKITKPSKEVDINAEIVVVEDEKPKGYWKLKELDEKWGFIKGVILDLGSSAGGFLIYASEKAKFVYGMEYSREFERELKKIEKEKNNVKVFIDNAFTFELSKIEEVDVILNDLTLDATSSFKVLERFLPKLRAKGKVLFVQKIGKQIVDLNFDELGLKIVKKEESENKKELYYLLEKC